MMSCEQSLRLKRIECVPDHRARSFLSQAPAPAFRHKVKSDFVDLFFDAVRPQSGAPGMPASRLQKNRPILDAVGVHARNLSTKPLLDLLRRERSAYQSSHL